MNILPYEQGFCDSLCGIYSIINAIRKINNNMSKKESMALFRKCMRHVEKRKRICTVGVNPSDVGSILRKVVTVKYGVEVKRPFRKTDEISVKEFFKEVRRYYAKGGKRSVIINIEGNGWDHWTVVRSLTTRSIMLFDSSSMKTVSISKCTFNKQTKRKPYLINPHSTFFLYQEEN